MSTTIQTVSRFLDAKAVKHRIEEDREIILASWLLPEAGPDGLNVIIDLQEDGEFLLVSAVRLLVCPADHEHVAKVLQVMAGAMWSTKMMRWEYDSSDGEVRASIHIPIEDSELTEQQLRRSLGCLLQMCGRYLPILNHAFATGDIDMSLEGPTASAGLGGLIEQFREFLETRVPGQSGLGEVDDDLPEGLPATEFDDFLGEQFRGGNRDPLN